MRHVAEGMGLRAIGKLPGMPYKREVWHRLDSDPDFAARYTRARAEAAEAIFEEIVDIADQEPERDEGRVDGGHVQHQRNRVDARKWVVAKMLPKKYGDRLEVEHSGSVVQITASDVAERLKGLRQLRQAKVVTLEAPPTE